MQPSRAEIAARPAALVFMDMRVLLPPFPAEWGQGLRKTYRLGSIHAMAELPAGRIRTDYLAWSLPAATLLFLFVGFVKGIVPSPIDITVCAGLAVLLVLVPFRDRLLLIDLPIAATLLALVCWLTLRLVPAFDPWGVRKLAEILSMGSVALAAGVMISTDQHARHATITILSWGGLPAAAIVVANAVLENPYSFSWVGSGGYQLTGTYLALAMVSAAISKNIILFAASALGCAVTGHISGALFGAFAVALVWAIEKDWRAAVNSVIATASLAALYTAFVAPPLVVMRILWKFGGVLLVWTNHPVNPEEAAAKLGTSHIGAGLLSILKAMPEDSQGYLVDYTAADRFDYFGTALSLFLDHPLFGTGYGAVDYLGSPYPHNAILELGAETGLIGAALASVAFVLAGRRAWQSQNSFAVGCYAVLFLSAMVSGYFGSRLLMFGFGLAMGAPLARKHKQPFP